MSENQKIQCQDGDTFTVAGMEFIKFPSRNGGTPVVLKDIAFHSEFGNNNDLRSSRILEKLEEEFLPKLIAAFGEENVQIFKTDLTTLDGLKPYGEMESRVSLVTLDFYRANAEIFGKYKPGSWWWMATPDSAQPNAEPNWLLCVSPSGFINFVIYNIDVGVRPFCILNSSIFES